MSWDATLVDDRGHTEGDWNYTHNTNDMIALALEAEGIETPPTDGPLGRVIGPAWWYRLDGLSGVDGRQYLDAIIRGLRATPETFRLINPSNGWGSYDGLLQVLTEMRDRVPDWPTVWHASG